MNVRIFWVCAMECMNAQTRPPFIPSSKRVLGNRTHVNSKGQIPSTGGSVKDWTHAAASGRTASPTRYPLSYCGPQICSFLKSMCPLRPRTSGAHSVCQRTVKVWSNSPGEPCTCDHAAILHSYSLSHSIFRSVITDTINTARHHAQQTIQPDFIMLFMEETEHEQTILRAYLIPVT